MSALYRGFFQHCQFQFRFFTPGHILAFTPWRCQLLLFSACCSLVDQVIDCVAYWDCASTIRGCLPDALSMGPHVVSSSVGCTVYCFKGTIIHTEKIQKTTLILLMSHISLMWKIYLRWPLQALCGQALNTWRFHNNKKRMRHDCGELSSSPDAHVEYKWTAVM